MEGVSFEEEKRYSTHAPTAPHDKGLSSLVIRLGLARDEKGVQAVFITTFVLCVAVAGIVWFFLGGTGATIPADEYQKRFENAGQVPKR